MVFLSGEQIGGFHFFAKLEEKFLSINDRGNVSLVTRILETETHGLRPPTIGAFPRRIVASMLC